MINRILERLEEEVEWASTHGTIEHFRKGRISGLLTAKRIVQEVAKECTDNTITNYLQFVRDNADREEFDNENGWSLADLIILATEFSPYQKGE